MSLTISRSSIYATFIQLRSSATLATPPASASTRTSIFSVTRLIVPNALCFSRTTYTYRSSPSPRTALEGKSVVLSRAL